MKHFIKKIMVSSLTIFLLGFVSLINAQSALLGTAGQWYGSTTQSNDIWRLGNVGIGWDNNLPIVFTEKLHINGAIVLGSSTGLTAGSIRYTGLDFEGRVGSNWKSLTSKWFGDGDPGGTIGTQASHIVIGSGNLHLGSPVPFAKFSIQMQNQDWDQGIGLHSNMVNGQDSYSYIIQSYSQGLKLKSDKGYTFCNSDGNTVLLFLDDWGMSVTGETYITGPVGIGDDSYNPNYKLNVTGNIRADEIVVNTEGADFVFEDNYNLKSLNEVETFIKQNKHLPEIPTATEVEENGVSLGEMQTKLLQKIEELTLYIIEQEKRIEELEKSAASN